MMRLIPVLFFLSTFQLLAQVKLIDLNNFDADYLNQLIIKAVNNERRKKRLDSVYVDSTLFPPAQNQSDYMAANNYIGHDQKKTNKLTFEKRMEVYGCNHKIAVENVQSIDVKFLLGKNKNRLTYVKLAKIIVDNWKKSSEHNKNMLNAQVRGINHGFAFKDGYLYITQILASKPFLDTYSYVKEETIYIKNKKPCRNCKKVEHKLNSGEGFAGWYTVSNDSIYYWNLKNYYKGKRKKNNIKLIFNHKGTITIDVIHHEQFDCKGSAAYDKSLYHDGYYINYVTKSSLQNDIHPSPDVYQVYVGQIPAFKDTFYQVDLNLSKMWKPCMNNSIVYVKPDYLEPKDYFLIPNPEIINNSEIVNKDSVQIKVAFKRNQTNEDTSIFQPLIIALDSIIKANHTVTSIFYTGVASIEGNEKSNTKLIKKRGIIIKNYLLKYYPNIEFKSLYYENFEDFRDGIALIGYPEIAKLDDDDMRRWVNQNLNNPKVEELLNTTRQSIVKINFRDVISFTNSDYGLSVKRLSDLIDEENYEESRLLFEVLAHQVFNGNQSKKDSLLNLSIPQAEGFNKLIWDYFVYELNVTNTKVTAKKLNELKDVGAIESSIDYLEYRLLFNIFNRSNAIDVDDFSEVLSTTRRKRTIAWLEVLDYISGVINYRYEAEMVAPLIVQSTLKNKFNVYKTYFVCQYLIEWDYTTEPYLLLSKFARQKGLFPKLYKQYIKLAYYLQQFDNKREWKKIHAALKILSQSYPNEFCDLFKWYQMGVRSLEKKEIAELFCKTCRG